LRKRKLNAARNFAVFYGSGNAERLARFDLAVVEPLGQQANNVRELQCNGALVLAYISILEAGPHMAAYGKLQTSDFLHVRGRMVMNEAFGTRIVDIRSPRWRSLLMEQAGRLLEDEGYDGLFLDTIGDAEDPRFPESVQDMMIEECESLLQEIKRRYPDRLLVQNNGLERLCERTSPLIDGICWENPPFDKPESDEWAAGVTERLRRLERDAGIRVLLLLERPESLGPKRLRKARELVKSDRFLLYQADRHYTGEIGEPDA